MHPSIRTVLTAATGALLLASQAALAGQTAQQQRAQKTAGIPICAKSLGALAVLDPKTNWWSP